MQSDARGTLKINAKHVVIMPCTCGRGSISEPAALPSGDAKAIHLNLLLLVRPPSLFLPNLYRLTELEFADQIDYFGGGHRVRDRGEAVRDWGDAVMTQRSSCLLLRTSVMTSALSTAFLSLVLNSIILLVDGYTVRTWYVAPGAEQSDPANCGWTSGTPCHGLGNVLQHACTSDPGFYTVELLSGVYTMTLFRNQPITLRDCQSLLVRAHDPTTPRAVRVYFAESGNFSTTVNRTASLADVLESDCDLESVDANYVSSGLAAFHIIRPRMLTIQGLNFIGSSTASGKNSQSAPDNILVIANGVDVTIDKCSFEDIPFNRRSLAIFNPAGPVTIVSSQFSSTETTEYVNRISPSYQSRYTGRAMVYILAGATNTSSPPAGRVTFSGCSFEQSCPHPNPTPTVYNWIVQSFQNANLTDLG